ncbi:hypothetical protein D9M71_815710 [compost metagenome]
MRLVEPFQLASGVKVSVDPLMLAAPSLEALTIWKILGAGESISVALSTTLPAVSSLMVRLFG